MLDENGSVYQAGLEARKIDLEKEKSKRSFWQTIIVSGASVIIVGIISAAASIYVSHLANENDVSLQKLKAQNDREVRLLTAQAELISSFKGEVVSADIHTRVRFAHMFSMLSLDDESRKRWADYHSQLVESYEEILKKEFSKSQSLYEQGKELPPALLRSGCEPFRVGGAGGRFLCP